MRITVGSGVDVDAIMCLCGSSVKDESLGEMGKAMSVSPRSSGASGSWGDVCQGTSGASLHTSWTHGTVVCVWRFRAGHGSYMIESVVSVSGRVKAVGSTLWHRSCDRLGLSRRLAIVR